MENINKEYTRIRREFDVYTDTSADYSLPDYNGDIKRVLYTSAEVSPASRFNEGDSISASGIVTYDIIYLNSENEIDHVTFSSDYDVSARLHSESISGSDIETRISSYSHRLFGPRRINMKATLTSEVRATETVSLDTAISECENGDTECILKNLSIATAVYAHSREREYAECISSLDGVMADEVEIIHSSAKCAFDSVKAEAGGISLSGNIIVSELIRCGESGPILYKKKIPFEEYVECEGAKPEMSAGAYANISSVSVGVTPEENGVSVTASVIAEYGVRAYGNSEVSVLRDAYLKTSASEAAYESITYNTHVGRQTKNLTATHTLPISEISDSGIENVIYTTAQGKVNSIAAEGGEAKIGIEMKVQGICSKLDEGGEESYHSVKCSFTAAEAVSLNSPIPDDAIIECSLRIIDTVATIDESNMYIDVLYSLDLNAERSNSEVRLSSLIANSEVKFEKKESEITVYYPSADDTLFSVAKAFHTSTKKIAADNMLTESVMKSSFEAGGLVGIRKLIIK